MNSVLTFFLYLLVGFVALTTVLAVLFPRRPLLGVSQHWGLQLWQLALLGAIAGIWLLDAAVIALSAAAALYWSWRLWPRRPPPVAAKAEPLLRVVSANLLYENADFA